LTVSPGSPPELTEHHARVVWEGDRADLRRHRIEVASQVIAGSSMPEAGGDAELADPEEMFVAALSACHMLWFLDHARRDRLRVSAYADDAVGELDGTRITRVELRPRVEFETEVAAEDLAGLHHRAHESCYLANSVSCPVEVVA
jgi:organic hydroperoxide reductase OsmC/OhrA